MSKELIYFRTLPNMKFRIDREKRIIYDVAIIALGAAKTHGMDVDAETLRQVVVLGNQAPTKSRFGHPDDAGTDAIGSLLGDFKNFRVDGDTVRADLYISPLADKSPRFPNMGTYTLDMAELTPEKCGFSIVFFGGKEMRDGRALVRVRDLQAVDLTDTPAASPSGIFSTRPNGQKEFSMADDDKEKEKKNEEVAALSADEIKQCRAMLKQFAETSGDDNATQKDITKQSQKSDNVIQLSQSDVDKAAEKGREEERAASQKYSTEFEGVMTASQFKADEREGFRKDFFGQPIESVKKFATKMVELRSKALGEGGAGGGEQKDGGQNVEVAALEKRFSEDRFARHTMGVTTDDPKSEDYKKGLQRYVAARLKVAAKK